MAEARALAVDVGGTRIRAAIVDAGGRIMHRQSIATPAAAGADAVVAAIVSACRAAAATDGAGRDLPVGLCAPGPIDARRGIALATPTIRGFTDFPLRAVLEEKLELAVTIENDGPSAALGEWAFGAGRGASDFVYVTISTGIGGGIVAEGRLLRGHKGLAGHVGHLPLFTAGGAVCFCGQIGCWEAEASGSALQRKACDAGFESLQEVFALAAQGRPAATAFVEMAADAIAPGLVSIAHLLSPERIVIGGGVSNGWDILAAPLRSRLRSRVLPPFREVDIRRSALGDDAGLLGAAQLAMRPDLRA